MYPLQLCTASSSGTGTATDTQTDTSIEFFVIFLVFISSSLYLSVCVPLQFGVCSLCIERANNLWALDDMTDLAHT